MYGSEHKNLIGFKVDIRMLYDFDEEEFDLGNVERCLSSASEAKILGDHGKLVREGRTNTSSLVGTTNNLPAIHTWIVQACSLFVSFNTVEYVDNNLFVVVPQFSLKFPTCVGQLGSFIDGISQLMTVKEDTELFAAAAAARLEESRETRGLMAFDSSRSHSLSLSHFTTAPGIINWFTPPKNDFAIFTASIINSEIFKDTPDNEFWSDDDEQESNLLNERLATPAAENDKEDEDFVFTEKGWYCRLTTPFYKQVYIIAEIFGCKCIYTA